MAVCEGDSESKRAQDLQVSGKKGSKGKTKNDWHDGLQRDLDKTDMSWNEEKKMAENRCRWQTTVQ